MNTRQYFFSAVALLLQIPFFAYSAGLVPCGGTAADGSPEPACQTCHVLGLINEVSAWLVTVLSLGAAILFAVAGFRILTAGGNPSAMQQAKGMMTNVAIGFIIVLSAWLLIDLMMKTLLSDGNTQVGPWNAIECVVQPVATTEQGFHDMRVAAGGSVGITGGSGTSVTQLDCQRISSTDFDCTAAEQQCEQSLNGVPSQNTSDPTQATVNCAVQVSTGSTGAGGSCEAITDVNNACHPSRLDCFGNSEGASRVCNLESAGGNTSAMSGSDLCADGSSFSGGLWQINILANHRLLPGCSGDFFTKSGSSAQGDCIDERTNSNGVTYCAVRNCRITDRAMYNHCVSQTLNPEINSQAACRLYSDAGGWRPWVTSANKCNVS